MALARTFRGRYTEGRAGQECMYLDRCALVVITFFLEAFRGANHGRCQAGHSTIATGILIRRSKVVGSYPILRRTFVWSLDSLEDSCMVSLHGYAGEQMEKEQVQTPNSRMPCLGTAGPNHPVCWVP